MTKALKKRFVATAMIAITLLLVVLIGAVNTANVVITNRRAEVVMNILTSGRGSYAPPDKRPNTDPRPGFSFPQRPSPDDMMGSRYFTVSFDTQGNITRTNINHIYAVTDEQARQIAQSLQDEAEDGQYEQFRYRTVTLPDGHGKLMLFLDTSAQLESIFVVLLASCGIGLVCWAVMLILVLLLSQKALSPIAANIEKQKQFVTNAGHEIKTPLAIILANTDALELHQGQSKWSRNIRAQTTRMSGLMQNLLTLSKMDEEGVVLAMTQFDASILLNECIQLQTEPAEARGLHLSAQITDSQTTTGNRDSIQQLFSILLDNAIKYAPENSQVDIRLFAADGKTSVQVSNLCPEPPEDTERLFDRFYRGDTARTQSANGGYGIGLSAARAIAQAHNGNVYAKYDNSKQALVFTAVF